MTPERFAGLERAVDALAEAWLSRAGSGPMLCAVCSRPATVTNKTERREPLCDVDAEGREVDVDFRATFVRELTDWLADKDERRRIWQKTGLRQLHRAEEFPATVADLRVLRDSLEILATKAEDVLVRLGFDRAVGNGEFCQLCHAHGMGLTEPHRPDCLGVALLARARSFR